MNKSAQSVCHAFDRWKTGTKRRRLNLVSLKLQCHSIHVGGNPKWSQLRNDDDDDDEGPLLTVIMKLTLSSRKDVDIGYAFTQPCFSQRSLFYSIIFYIHVGLHIHTRFNG